MDFRPCIDIHNGRVKQIVGGSLRADGGAQENFVSGQDAAYYACLYRSQGLKEGHVILLNARDSDYYEATKRQAVLALREYPNGLQAGGGITAENAAEFLDAGASAVIVTSYVFQGGQIHYGNLERLVSEVGREHLVLDLSCRRKEQGGDYYIVTDRWQSFTDARVTEELMEELGGCCREFLVHAVDVEGKADGIERELVALLGGWGKIPITYAGGIHSFTDLDDIYELGRGRLNLTIGSALDLFGGPLPYLEVLDYIKEKTR